MPVINHYTSELMTIFGNMVYNDDNKIEERMLEALFPKWRQEALSIIYNGTGGIRGVLQPMKANKFINAANYMQTEYTYDATIQDEGAEYVKYIVEPAVQIDGMTNGFRFVGDKLSRTSYKQLPDPNSYSIYKDAKMIGINDVAFNVTGDEARFFGNLQIKNPFFDYLPLNPINVRVYDRTTKSYREFNEETDNYPISPDVWSVMKALAIAELTPPNYRPADYTSDASTPLEKQAKS